jgi:hypothetical protein
VDSKRCIEVCLLGFLSSAQERKERNHQVEQENDGDNTKVEVGRHQGNENNLHATQKDAITYSWR